MLTRRLFLFGAMSAPAIVRSASLMPLYVPPSLILYADGVRDDTEALQAWIDGDRRVIWQGGQSVGPNIIGHRFKIGSHGIPLHIRDSKIASPKKIIANCYFVPAFPT